MATPNYGYEKRQRELAKKKKKEEKLRAKAAGKHTDDSGQEIGESVQGDSPSEQEPAAGSSGGA